MSASEAEEYKKTTLTGANVPYNPQDPRQEPRDVNKLETCDGIYVLFYFDKYSNMLTNISLFEKHFYHVTFIFIYYTM